MCDNFCVELVKYVLGSQWTKVQKIVRVRSIERIPE